MCVGALCVRTAGCGGSAGCAAQAAHVRSYIWRTRNDRHLIAPQLYTLPAHGQSMLAYDCIRTDVRGLIRQSWACCALCFYEHACCIEAVFFIFFASRFLAAMLAVAQCTLPCAAGACVLHVLCLLSLNSQTQTSATPCLHDGDDRHAILYNQSGLVTMLSLEP